MQNPHLWDVQVGTEEEAQMIDKRLAEFNGRHVPFTQELDANGQRILSKNYIIKNDNMEIIAGIRYEIYYWKILGVLRLFVEKSYRHQKLGSLLLNKVEQEARAFGATLAHLDTFDFQAKDFYLKHGYKVFGVLDDCPPGHQRFYLKKNLVTTKK